ILTRRAASGFGVTAGWLLVDDGLVFTKDGAKRTSYWELADEKPFAREATGTVPPTAANDHKIVGQPEQRIDIPDKVMGRPIFIQDLRLPGMVFGRVV